jgi:predicted N-acyltransferase
MDSLRRRLQARRKLRQPSGFRFALADSIHLIDATRWDAVTASQSWFFSRDYLAMLESAPPSAIEPRYALITEPDGRPVAAVVMQWVEVAGTDLRPLPAPAAAADDELNPLLRFAAQLADRSARAMVRGLRERVLVCGNLLSYGQHAVAMADGVDPASVWPAVAEALYRVRRAEKLAGQAGFVLIKDLTPQHAKPIQVLADLSYRPVETEPNMLLALDPSWRRHEDYLASLASKYRSAIKNRILEPIRGAGLEVRNFDVTADQAARVHELYLQVHQNAAVRPFTLHPDYFAALARAAGERARFTGIFSGTQLLGFIVTLMDGVQALGYHIGFDRAAAAEHPLYLRLLHASVEQAIALGARELSLGRTALEPKSRLGAKAQPVQLWVRHRQPVFNKLVKRMLALVQHDDAPEHDPFKKGPPAAGK